MGGRNLQTSENKLFTEVLELIRVATVRNLIILHYETINYLYVKYYLWLTEIWEATTGGHATWTGRQEIIKKFSRETTWKVVTLRWKILLKNLRKTGSELWTGLTVQLCDQVKNSQLI
jgi:hypothetical protein